MENDFSGVSLVVTTTIIDTVKASVILIHGDNFSRLEFELWKWPKRKKSGGTKCKLKYGKWEFDIWKWPNRKKKRFVIVGGGYVTRTFVEKGVANEILCIISKEAFAPYERPTLTKRGERQTPDWYKEKGIEMLYGDQVTEANIDNKFTEIWIPYYCHRVHCI